MDRVTSKGLIKVNIFGVKWGIQNEIELNLFGCHSLTY